MKLYFLFSLIGKTRLEALEDRRMLAPVADVSLSENTGFVGLPVALDGTRSSDPEGDPLTFNWDITLRPDGSTVQIMSSNTETPTLTPDVRGNYRVQLMVNDGVQESAPVSFVVDVNRPPVADVSLSESTGVVGTPVQLNGTRSFDPEGESLTFNWEFFV